MNDLFICFEEATCCKLFTNRKRRTHNEEERRAHNAYPAASAVVALGLVAVLGPAGAPSAGAQTALGATTPQQEVDLSRILALEQAVQTLQHAVNTLLTCISLQAGEINGVAGPHLVITGCNVHIRSGSGATNDNFAPTNLGNLIIGYNEPRRGTDTMDRTGSHNLVVGPEHKFTASGGLLGGFRNTASGAVASVSGGDTRTASGLHDWVAGALFEDF